MITCTVYIYNYINIYNYIITYIYMYIYYVLYFRYIFVCSILYVYIYMCVCYMFIIIFREGRCEVASGYNLPPEEIWRPASTRAASTLFGFLCCGLFLDIPIIDYFNMLVNAQYT